MKEAILSEKAPRPIGPYSQAIKIGGLVFLSGIIPLWPSGEVLKGNMADQFRLIIQNAKAILESAGTSMDDVIKVTVYMKDLKDFDAMNEVYASVFRPPFPARSTVQVAALPRNVDIEVDLIAAV